MYSHRDSRTFRKFPPFSAFPRLTPGLFARSNPFSFSATKDRGREQETSYPWPRDPGQPGEQVRPTDRWCGFTARRPPRSRGVLGPPDPKLQYHDHVHTTSHGFREQWEPPDVPLYATKFYLTGKSDWKIQNLTEKPAHLSDFHCPSPFFGQWFHSSNSFKVQSSKNNSHLQRGETQCALYTPAFDSYNYFSAPYKFCFTEFNEIVCRVGARLGPH